MPRIDRDGFCLATPRAVSQIKLCRSVRMLGGTRHTTTTSSAALIYDIRADIYSTWQQRIGEL